MQATQVTDSISIADQPSLDELRELAADGYVAIVNLRREGEPDQPLSPVEEAAQARAAGLAYLHEAIGGAPLTPENVANVVQFLEQHAPRGKVLVHCRRGARAAAVVLVHLARKEGWGVRETIDRGQQQYGLNVDGNLRIMVELFLAQQAMQS